MSALSVSIVTFRPDLEMLEKTVSTLAIAAKQAMVSGAIQEVRLLLVDNEPGGMGARRLQNCLDRWPWEGELISGHGNVGYGRGHNLAIERTTSEYHLVLNPDVILSPSSLEIGLRYLEQHTDIGLLTPEVSGRSGDHEFLCRRYPSLVVLAFRLLWPQTRLPWIRRKLDHYEMRDVDWSREVDSIPIASGCFMLFRSSMLKRVNGFASEYFLYFEDYDLSLRVGKISRIGYFPAMKVQHFGGGAGRKGLRHILLFSRSALTFFSRNGWRVS
jgi:GT2 family glycosyltransferase